MSAVDVLTKIASTQRITSYCESDRFVETIGEVKKEVILQDSTEVLLFAKDRNTFRLALKLPEAMAFEYFETKRDYKDLVRRVYNRLNSMGPDEMISPKKIRIDFRGLGI